MPIRSLFPLSFLFLALLLAPGCDRAPQAKAPQAAAPLPEVGVVVLAPQDIPLSTVLAGRTSPHLVAQVRPQVSGIILERSFTEGSDVVKGQPLYRIDPSTYRAAHDNAKAALAEAVANAEPLGLKARRYAELVTTGSVSQQDNDDAQAAHRQALAAIEVAKATLQSARIDLDHTTITAPISGRIGASLATPGALVTANQSTALATIQQIDPIYVDVTQSSRDLLRLRRALADGSLARSNTGAATARLLYEDDTPYALAGALQFADLTVDENTGAYTLRALFPNPGHDLLPGMYVKAVLEEGVARQAILVPQKAVSRNPKGNPYVMLVAADGAVVQREFTADRAIGENWLATAGLAAGDRVVVDGLQKIRAGVKVTVAAAPAPAQQ